jgi:hypothetical protein
MVTENGRVNVVRSAAGFLELDGKKRANYTYVISPIIDADLDVLTLQSLAVNGWDHEGSNAVALLHKKLDGKVSALIDGQFSITTDNMFKAASRDRSLQTLFDNIENAGKEQTRIY